MTRNTNYRPPASLHSEQRIDKDFLCGPSNNSYSTKNLDVTRVDHMSHDLTQRALPNPTPSLRDRFAELEADQIPKETKSGAGAARDIDSTPSMVGSPVASPSSHDPTIEDIAFPGKWSDSESGVDMSRPGASTKPVVRLPQLDRTTLKDHVELIKYPHHYSKFDQKIGQKEFPKHILEGKGCAEQPETKHIFGQPYFNASVPGHAVNTSSLDASDRLKKPLNINNIEEPLVSNHARHAARNHGGNSNRFMDAVHIASKADKKGASPAKAYVAKATASTNAATIYDNAISTALPKVPYGMPPITMKMPLYSFSEPFQHVELLEEGLSADHDRIQKGYKLSLDSIDEMHYLLTNRIRQTEKLIKKQPDAADLQRALSRIDELRTAEWGKTSCFIRGLMGINAELTKMHKKLEDAQTKATEENLDEWLAKAQDLLPSLGDQHHEIKTHIEQMANVSRKPLGAAEDVQQRPRSSLRQKYLDSMLQKGVQCAHMVLVLVGIAFIITSTIISLCPALCQLWREAFGPERLQDLLGFLVLMTIAFLVVGGAFRIRPAYAPW